MVDKRRPPCSGPTRFHQHQCSCSRMSSQNGFCQHLCSQRESQFLPASLGGSPRSAHEFNPSSFKTTDSSLGLAACEILCEPFKSESLFPRQLSLCNSPYASPPTLPMQALLTFKARHSRGSTSWCRNPRLGSPMWDSEPHSLVRTSAIVIILQFVGHPAAGVGLD